MGNDRVTQAQMYAVVDWDRAWQAGYKSGQEAASAEIERLRTMLAELEPLTPRAIRVLRTAGITTKEEARKLWHNDFLRMPTCGRKTAHEIYEWARR